MKKLDHNALYRYYILSILYTYISVRGILYESLLLGKGRRRAAMAEPLVTRKGSVILIPFILINISIIFLQNKICSSESIEVVRA